MDNHPDFAITDGVLERYTGPGGDITIPDGVTRISFQAFPYCDTLERVVIPEGVTSIGKHAFYLSGLPKGPPRDLAVLRFCQRSLAGEETPRREECLKYIKNQRKHLFPLAVAHPEVLQLMFRETFLTNKDVDPLLDEADRQQNIPAKSAVLEYCHQKLTPVDPMEAMEKELARTERVAAYLEKTGVLPIGELRKIWSWHGDAEQGYTLDSYKSKAGPDVVVPASIGGVPVVCIGIKAFQAMVGPAAIKSARREMTSVTIPEGVTSIQYSAFHGCTSLTTVTLPDSLTKIDTFAFKDCPNLVLRVSADSYGERFALQNGLNYERNDR